MPRRVKAPIRRWDRAFDDPISLPNGSELVTLRDAGNYIAKLPKREHDAPEWQAAIRALMLVVEHDGQTLLARIGMMRTLYRPVHRRRRHARKLANATPDDPMISSLREAVAADSQCRC